MDIASLVPLFIHWPIGAVFAAIIVFRFGRWAALLIERHAGAWVGAHVELVNSLKTAVEGIAGSLNRIESKQDEHGVHLKEGFESLKGGVR